MGFFGWFFIIVIVLIILEAISSGNDKEENEKKLSEAPSKLSRILKEEFPSFADDITTVKCGLIFDMIMKNEKLIRKAHDSKGKLKKNEKSISIVREFSVNQLAPLISGDFHIYAKSEPESFFSSFNKAIELSV